MKKSITKEQIIKTTLDLLKDESDIRNVNLRRIARVMGCAHTNLYNYFPSFNELLWEAHIEIENKFVGQISLNIDSAENYNVRLYQFYFALSGLYLDNKGWFRLLWMDYIDDKRPEKDIIATENAVDVMIEILKDICACICPEVSEREKMHDILHDVHCYIVGEVSNFINGRGLIQDKKLLREHIAETSATFFMLRLKMEM